MVRPFTIPSGADPATQVLDGFEVVLEFSTYINFFEEGRDAEYFTSTIIDDDDDPGRYNFTYGPNRPLPEGLYEVESNWQMPYQIPCDYRPESIYKDEVTAVASAGTLHEAFFDPVTVGTAVKADGSNGVLKPTSFTVGNTSTELTSLEWSKQPGGADPWHPRIPERVRVGVHRVGRQRVVVPLHRCATVDSAAGTYSWPMTSQPWEDGDQLMVRIREG